MVLSIVFTVISLTPSYVTYANSEIDALNKQIEALEKEQKELTNKISNAKSEREKQEAIKDKASKDGAIVASQIAVLEEKITVMENNIVEKEEAIANLSNDIDENYELFKGRMRSMYMSDNITAISVILGAGSFSDFLAQGEIMKSIAEHDQQLIADLTASKENEEALKAGLDADNEALADTKLAAQYKKEELDRLRSTTEQKINEISQQEKEFKANEAVLKKQMDEVKEEIDDIYAKLEWSGDEFSGKPFKLPVPGYSTITSYYGWRFGGSDYHTGIDFSGANIYRKPAVASNDGIVNYVTTSYTPNRGYGRYVIIDHGGGYSTLYGHLDSISVKKGERVSAGEQIGKVGTTGWSTGPHIHFEIRMNGKHKNPYNYLF